jgi:hypothetical protein
VRRKKRGTLKSGKGGKGGTVKEPKASHRHRAFGGARKRRESTQEESSLARWDQRAGAVNI